MSTGVIVVTGGNRGIGAAIVRRLADAGHRVVVASRSGIGPDDCVLMGAVAMDRARISVKPRVPTKCSRRLFALRCSEM